ncbi:MAG: DUF1289 domain-containing protein, partial [Planctomycetes bacterium]|nr:DUF1289 domain-containing protein [Planctomycetota bacterium]
MPVNEAPRVPPPLSPCLRICRLDERDECVGCRRTRDEIAAWWNMTDAQKRA